MINGEGAKFRVLLRSRTDGAEFPIWTASREEATEAAESLDAEVVSVAESSPAEFAGALLQAVLRGTNIIPRRD